MADVAVLYVDPRGPYPAIADRVRTDYLMGLSHDRVDCWDESRDARMYPGPAPIVAHPPCGAWGRLKHMSHGHGRDCGPIAVAQVRAFGGVLEHPADSDLWDAMLLPRPGELPDAWGGYSVRVDQSDWGHVARKPTWLYLVGVPKRLLEYLPRREPTHWVSGARDRRDRRGGGVVPPGIKICSAQQRRRSPRAFAEYLIRLARSVRG